jgi:DNA-binding protein H-NS
LTSVQQTGPSDGHQVNEAHSNLVGRSSETKFNKYQFPFGPKAPIQPQLISQVRRYKMPRRAAPKLDAMSLAELRQLRDEVQTALSGKIQMEREELQRKLNELSNLESAAGDGNGHDEVRLGRPRKPAGRRAGGNGKTHSLKGRTVEPKYRDPANPSQTWAGRGLAPKWLTAYEQQGRKRKEFLIGKTAAAR